MRILFVIALVIALTACTDANEKRRERLTCKINGEVTVESGLHAYWFHRDGAYHANYPEASYTPVRGEFCEIQGVSVKVSP